MKTRVLLAHPGTQHAAHLARELHVRNLLKSFHTSIGISADSSLMKIIVYLARWFKMQKELQNRIIKHVPSEKIITYSFLEAKVKLKQRKAPSSLYRLLRERNKAFQRGIPQKAIAEADVIIGYDTSSLLLIKKAHTLGKKYIIDQTIAHPISSSKTARLVGTLFPDWKSTWEEKPEYELQDELQEHMLADIIVCPSNFVAKSLIENGISANKIRINPFGTDTEHFTPERAPNFWSTLNPLVFVFVGAITARKGLPLLIDAWKKLNPSHAQLWVVGSGTIPSEVLNNMPSSICLLGKVSRDALPSILQRSHVFVFPSFFEGLAQVQLEAAACGLPIIGTTASGAEEIVEEGKTGFIIEPGSLEQLTERLELFLNRPALAIDMYEYAKERSSLWSWSAYGDRWETILNEFS